MSNIYDNWERLVAAVLKREEIWQIFHEQSKSPSIISCTSSDLSRSLGGQTPSLAITKYLNPPRVPSTAPTLSRGDGKSLISAVPPTKIAWYRRRKARNHSDDTRAKEEDVVVHLRQVTRFSLRQLQVATDNFSDKNQLRTRIGSVKVYKGRLEDGSLVEVIRINEERSDDRNLQFQRELEIGSNSAHRNLLCLRGFCKTSTDRFLVYPFMVNGTVATCLGEKTRSQPLLDWCTRKRIALGSARGLVYLHEHCDPKIIHCGIKAANILLDEEFEVFVGNFSRAKLVKYNQTMGDLSSFDCPEKIDAFSYGVLLLELITGLEDSELTRLANDKNVSLLDWVKGLLKNKKLETLVDTSLKGNYAMDEVEQLTQVALICTQRSPFKRPKMSEILRMLEGNLLDEKWKKMHKDDMFLQPLIQTSLPNIYDENASDI